jgi:hypothetical protein
MPMTPRGGTLFEARGGGAGVCSRFVGGVAVFIAAATTKPQKKGTATSPHKKTEKKVPTASVHIS